MKLTAQFSEREHQRGNSTLIIIGVVAVAAVIGLGFMMTRSKPADKMAPDTNQEVLVDDSTMMPVEQTNATNLDPAESQMMVTDENGVKTFNIEAGAFYYNPAEIRVKQGETVKIVMTSKDMMHDFRIDELNVQSEIAKAGETTTVEFVASEVGTFEYYCSVGQHRANGQVGKLIVE